MNKGKYTIILFYKFTNIPMVKPLRILDKVGIKNLELFRDKQKQLALRFNLKGRMLIAKEGINATFEGTVKDIKGYIKEFKKQKRFSDVVFKQSDGTGKAFTKLLVKVRPETVTLGVGDLNVKKYTAKMITAEQLNKMYDKKEDFVILDLRNDYEISVGKFENTVNPRLRFFRELPEKIKELEYLKNKKVITVCTGDIRCEKGTCLLKKEGFENIYQLKDGIHTYMQRFPNKHFKGSLFVFDNRMTTAVVDKKGREVIGRCAYCNKKCEEFYNDDSARPSTKIICCDKCIVRRKSRLRKCVPV